MLYLLFFADKNAVWLVSVSEYNQGRSDCIESG